MKITVLYNVVTSAPSGVLADLLADEDTIKTARAIKDILADLGHDSELLEINEANFEEILRHPTDLFYNQAFGVGNSPQSEAQVAQLLAKSGKPYTGSDKNAIEISNDKIATKYLFLKNHIPTPKFAIVDSANRTIKTSLRFPVIVKLTREHCSVGMSADSVIFEKDHLSPKVDQLLDNYHQEVIVEEFIDGRELNVTVVGNGEDLTVLPISEITFGPYFQNHPKIVDFAAKWEEESSSYKETVGVCPSPLMKKTEEMVKALAKSVYLLSGCHDYARVDFRLDAAGKPFVLEFNANPGLGPTDGAIRSAKAAGFSYSQFLQKIVDLALTRAQNP